MTLRVQDYLVLYKCDKRRENRLYMGGPLNILNIGPIGHYYSKYRCYTIIQCKISALPDRKGTIELEIIQT